MTANWYETLAPFFQTPSRSDVASRDSLRPADSPPWVLHVDDDAEYSWTIKCRLESLGVAVVRAFDGADGTRCAFDYPADAILLDMQMPNGTGEDVLRYLKSNERTSRIPVIMLTSLKSTQQQQQSLASGASGYVTKDRPFEELVAEIGKHIDLLTPTGC